MCLCWHLKSITGHWHGLWASFEGQQQSSKRPWWANKCTEESGGREVPGRWLLDTKIPVWTGRGSLHQDRDRVSTTLPPEFQAVAKCSWSYLPAHNHTNIQTTEATLIWSSEVCRGPECKSLHILQLIYVPLRSNQQKYVDQITSRKGKLTWERRSLTLDITLAF